MMKLIPIIILIVLLGISKISLDKKAATAPVPAPEVKPIVNTPPVVPSTPPEVVVTPPKPSTGFSNITIQTDDSKKELESLYGPANIEAILEINRIDLAHIKKGSVLVIPDSFDQSFSSFPQTISELADIPKIFLISQRVQAFGAYEYGNLVRTGPVSSGKKSTPTANKLFFANWKGKEVISTINGEWLLKWNVNLDNFDGIGMHQYDMPGYPASHSCVRMLEADAMWVYDWVEQWILTPDGNTRLAAGTPVIVFGDYKFGTTAPWKQLTTDASAVTLKESEIKQEIDKYLEEIKARLQERNLITAKNQ